MRQEQKKGEKHQSIGNLIKLGVLTLAVTSAYRLLFGAIKHGGQVYEDGEESAPITTRRDEGWGWRKVSQILKGKRRGGRVITESQTIFTHSPEQNDRRRTSQSLGPGKVITLTDGTIAEGE
ncbi:MAG: hypothetical protein UR54_C0016G0006 [Candidatus Roizmanbacteria bacterium GW2011_GWA2_34_18]|uniref:Uncharacterized protein n=1 Tax=Candidatus Roizmanbacteria bacterium GW2011_GWA2_34_18 TaxID=1618477 RepID=A0A0G0B968_9BACT|nr:MAG: hypothetical protein UR54_C0016G0006 [Candidatus Roizmanbacteria bacterium GW2011_GWA2_34_18]